ncbi:helix-turn-helix domain-containing protein [Mycobacterium tuberculosis]|uniref:helix-turn-helix domain-containing protein n=1 Tax=Mycobacterium tuberculosis TaxID=1773 RepID=UPI00272B5EE8|nr:LysR family transcriptional regulator [Mycobacterium tuberculosis]
MAHRCSSAGRAGWRCRRRASGRTGSISDASARLHVAVSAISRQIAKLESELGAPTP